MEFRYSEIVDPPLHETEGLSGGIDVRKSRFTELEDRGAIRAHQDWARHVGPCTGYRGGLGPEYSFISVVMPECIPERMEVVAYANEFAFMYDDIVECMGCDLGQTENNQIMNGFLEASQLRSGSQPNAGDEKAGKKQIQSLIFSEMLSIDPDCAKTTMKAWAQFIESGSAREHDVRFKSMAEYIPYRIKDVGEMYWYGVVTFGMALRIPDHELERCQALVAPAWIAVGLQNDLWSWPKEVEAAKDQGKDHVINSIWVLMQEHSISVREAMQICRQLIKGYVAEYLATVEAYRDGEALSGDLRRYLLAIKYSISGHLVWSLNCPRYNPEVAFNKRQRAWMCNGVPAIGPSPDLTLQQGGETGYMGGKVALPA
ncbi:fusicoccadiene synthase [Apiospora aurea]|uniref:Fusicoccadiene synthase n=1 Tax=Apiospora aurea TaxID=335848 RepID=A0ABR1QIF7_9PEZI